MREFNVFFWILSMAFVLPFALGQELEWKNNKGQLIMADFVSGTHDTVTISMKGKIFTMRHADLSPPSQALAKKLNEMSTKIQRLEKENLALQGKGNQDPPDLFVANKGIAQKQPEPAAFQKKDVYSVAELKPLLLRGFGPGMRKQKLKQLFGPPNDTAEEGKRWIYKNKVMHPDTDKPTDLYILIQMGQSIGTGFNYDEIISFRVGYDGEYFVGWAN